MKAVTRKWSGLIILLSKSGTNLAGPLPHRIQNFPRLESQMGPNEIYKVNELVGGLTLMAFTKVTTGMITLKAQARYGENISDVLAVSGFAVQDI